MDKYGINNSFVEYEATNTMHKIVINWVSKVALRYEFTSTHIGGVWFNHNTHKYLCKFQQLLQFHSTRRLQTPCRMLPNQQHWKWRTSCLNHCTQKNSLFYSCSTLLVSLWLFYFFVCFSLSHVSIWFNLERCHFYPLGSSRILICFNL